MSEETGRAQDQARRHRRRAPTDPATRSLLAEYQAAMRDELRAILSDLAGKPPKAGLLDADLGPALPVRPPLKERAALWDLGIKIGRELGTAVDIEPGAEPAGRPAPRKWARSRVDYGAD